MKKGDERRIEMSRPSDFRKAVVVFLLLSCIFLVNQVAVYLSASKYLFSEINCPVLFHFFDIQYSRTVPARYDAGWQGFMFAWTLEIGLFG